MPLPDWKLNTPIPLSETRGRLHRGQPTHDHHDGTRTRSLCRDPPGAVRACQQLSASLLLALHAPTSFQLYHLRTPTTLLEPSSENTCSRLAAPAPHSFPPGALEAFPLPSSSPALCLPLSVPDAGAAA